MERSLDDLLSDEPAEAVEAAPQEAPTETAEPETIGQPRDESGRFASKEETGAETPQETPAEPVSPTEQKAELRPEEHPALIGERRRRQEAEDREREKDARIASLERQFQSMQQPPQAHQPQHRQMPQEKPDRYEDPDGHDAYLIAQARQAALADYNALRLNQAERAAMQKHPDFREKLDAFQQAAMLNPALINEMIEAHDPATFAYERGSMALEVQRYGSVDALLAAEKAKWEQEARAAMPAPTAALPSTTATDGSVGGRTGPAWAGPVPLDQLLG
jgi:hypothetical protein